MKKILAPLMLLILVGCTTPATPKQAIHLVKTDYAVALKVELVYSYYPRCAAGQTFKITKPCSTVKMIRKMQEADNAAKAAIDEADEAAWTPGFGKENKVITTLATAKALTNTFKILTDAYKIN